MTTAQEPFPMRIRVLAACSLTLRDGVINIQV